MKKNTIGRVLACQVCGSGGLTPILSLGHQPIVQEYLKEEGLHEPEVTYPLNAVLCRKCGLLQLDYIPDPKVVFPPHYPYRTGLTNMLIRNFRELADILERDYPWKKGDLIVDVGSNDGTLLSGFKDKGMKVLGVEPTGAAKVANKNGIKTIQDFFNNKVVNYIKKKYGLAKVITAANVFAHINDAPALAKNISNLLDKNGVFISESQYLMDIVEKLEFDTIYHEHLRFYSLKPIKGLLEDAGMSMIDAERISAAGGSIRVYAKKGKWPVSSRAKDLMRKEEEAGLTDEKTLLDFAAKAYEAKNDLLALLLKLKKGGARIAALTSPARSNPLLNFTKINDTILDYAGEKKGSPKIGLYTPGTHIRVVDESRIFEDQPDYVLVLSWHIGQELIKKVREAGYKGKFILPLPVPRIVNLK
ncbi:MAG: class I SAM-dependent methyltransferase [bacterium]|nr:class I SAM-dependent methyltransferase [bacterium]